MANVINRTTYKYLTSVNTPDYDVADWLHSPDLSGVSGVPKHYWKVVGDAVEELTPAEKTAIAVPKYESGKSMKSERQKDTSASEYQDKVFLITDVLKTGTSYHLYWYCEVKNDKNNGSIQYEVSVNGTVVADPISKSTEWVSGSGIKELDTTGSVTITLRFKKINSGTASIRRARLLILSDN